MWETEKYLAVIITFAALGALIIFLVSVPSMISQNRKPGQNAKIYTIQTEKLSYSSNETTHTIVIEGKVPIQPEKPAITPVSTQILQIILNFNTTIRNCFVSIFQSAFQKQ